MDDEYRITNKRLLVADFSLRSFQFNSSPGPFSKKRMRAKVPLFSREGFKVSSFSSRIVHSVSPPLMGGDDLVVAGFSLQYHIGSKMLDNPENGYYSAKT